jgi:subtilase family serine protease
MIGTRTVAALRAGMDSGPVATTLTLPSNINGSYTIQTCADDTLAVFESDETNNCRSSSTMSIGAPDMVVRSVTAPSSAISGANITLVDTTANQGVADARTSVTRFYLVSGTTRVVALGTRSVGVLPVGASSGPASTTIALPTNIVGTYTVQACADDTLTVSESDESNNCASSSALTVAGADMVVSSINAPSTATGGGSITMTDTTFNRGPADARASVTRFYLLNGSTRVAVLGTRYVVALTSGSSSGPVSTSLTLPAKTTGAFTIQACADDTLTVSESDESNNCTGSTALTITK